MKIPFHTEQLEFMKRLAENRIECLNPLFRFLNYFDSDYFFFILIPIIWLGVSYQWGLRIYYWATLNNLLILSAKNLIGWPRPSQDIPELGMFHPQTFGFPSGGAQTCFFLGALLIYYWKTRAAWTIGISYIVLISFSRLYLGVHYPLDILGGWIAALFLFLSFIYSKDPLERFLHRIGIFPSFLLSIAIPAAILLIANDPRITYIFSAVIGIGIGTYFSLKKGLFLAAPKSFTESVARSFFGIVMIFTLYIIWPPEWPKYAKSFTLSLFMSVAASPIAKRLLRRSNT